VALKVARCDAQSVHEGFVIDEASPPQSVLTEREENNEELLFLFDFVPECLGGKKECMVVRSMAWER
jgi:hypothetical protein